MKLILKNFQYIMIEILLILILTKFSLYWLVTYDLDVPRHHEGTFDLRKWALYVIYGL